MLSGHDLVMSFNGVVRSFVCFVEGLPSGPEWPLNGFLNFGRIKRTMKPCASDVLNILVHVLFCIATKSVGGCNSKIRLDSFPSLSTNSSCC